MPTQSSLRRPHVLRGGRVHRVARHVKCPTVGQCFDIEVTRGADGWTIRIPEIGKDTRAARWAAVELTARECIAGWTGIPIGYVAVAVVSEIG